MPKTFEELMQEFQNPGENGIPETFLTDLQETYQHDLSVRDAAVKDREDKLVEAEKAKAATELELTRVKAVNYDLIKAAPKAGNPADDNKPDGDADQGGIDSLFG